MGKNIDILMNPATKEVALFSEDKFIGIFKRDALWISNNHTKAQTAIFHKDDLIGLFDQYSTQFVFDEYMGKDGVWGNEQDMRNRIETSKKVDLEFMKNHVMKDQK